MGKTCGWESYSTFCNMTHPSICTIIKFWNSILILKCLFFNCHLRNVYNTVLKCFFLFELKVVVSKLIFSTWHFSTSKKKHFLCKQPVVAWCNYCLVKTTSFYYLQPSWRFKVVSPSSFSIWLLELERK